MMKLRKIENHGDVKISNVAKRAHVNDYKNFLFMPKHCMNQQIFYILLKWWSPLISKYYFHGLVESKISCNQHVKPSLENLDMNMAIKCI
jgi:hypothetical protein